MMTAILASVAIVLWIVALSKLSRDDTRTSVLTPPPDDKVSRHWLAQFHSRREEE